MKRYFITVICLVISYVSYGQNTFPSSGNVGIGTSSPGAKLHVMGNVKFSGNYDGTNNINFDPDGGVGNSWELYPQPSGFGIFSRTNYSFPLYITNQDNIGIGTLEPENAEGWSKVLEIKEAAHSKLLVSSNQISTGIWSHNFGFYGAPAGGITGTATNHPFSIITNKTTKMVITAGGDVAIGTTNPNGYKLAVNGKIRAQEIKVEASPWPDYVFAKDYPLRTLQQTKHHIKEKGHLPGIPSAAEVRANGIDLGEMNAKLLQKIEELTLHLIEQNKMIKAQQKEMDILKIRLATKLK